VLLSKARVVPNVGIPPLLQGYFHGPTVFDTGERLASCGDFVPGLFGGGPSRTFHHPGLFAAALADFSPSRARSAIVRAAASPSRAFSAEAWADAATSRAWDAMPHCNTAAPPRPDEQHRQEPEAIRGGQCRLTPGPLGDRFDDTGGTHADRLAGRPASQVICQRVGRGVAIGWVSFPDISGRSIRDREESWHFASMAVPAYESARRREYRSRSQPPNGALPATRA